MKTKAKVSITSSRHHPTEEEIRDYAYHLYEQSGRIPGRDLDNWLEAKAGLAARIPKHRAHLRLHRHPELSETIDVVVLDAEGFPVLEEMEVTGDRAYEGGRIVVGAPPP